MLRHFTGSHDHKVDAKGRVSLPTEFRRVLESMDSAEAVFIVPQYESPEAHVGFSTQGYAALIARHNAHAYPTKEHMRRESIRLIGRARQIQVDQAGRIVLSEDLRRPLKIDKLVRFVGDADSFEIWHPDANDAYEQALFDLPALAEPLDRRGLH